MQPRSFRYTIVTMGNKNAITKRQRTKTGLRLNEMPKVPEVARIAGVDPETVRYWLRNGRLKGWQDPANRWHVDADDLERFLKLREEERNITATVANLAKASKTDPETIRTWLRNKKISGIKRGKKWVITDDRVDFTEDPDTHEVSVYLK